MSTAPVPGFPNAFQTEYARESKAPLPGSFWEGEFWDERPLSAVLPHLDAVAFVKTFTFANSTADGATGINLAGGDITIAPSGDNTTDATTFAAALTAAGFAATYIAGSVPAAAVVTVTGVLGQDPVITAVEEGSTTLAIGITTPAVLPLLVCFGEGVVRYDDGTGLNTDKFRPPTALTDQFLGVLSRSSGSKIPAGQIAEGGAVPALDPALAVPGFPYSIERENVGLVVETIGDAPGMLDPVYLIMIGTSAGKWAKVDGAVSKVVILTTASVADGNIGFGLDGLTALSLTATASVINDAASLFALLKADASYRALFTDYLTDAVDNLDGTLTLTFAPGIDPAFLDASTGTSSVAQGTLVAAVAANAVAHPEYSWGKPSILAAADEPARSFLRLSRS